MKLIEAFQLGGWAMWFILVFGLIAVVAAARFAFRGAPALALFSRWMALCTALAGVFGFFAGMIMVCRYVTVRSPTLSHENRISVFIEGLGEALNNLTFSSLLATLTCLLLAVGYRRFPEQASSR